MIGLPCTGIILFVAGQYWIKHVPISRDHRELFRIPNTLDKLNLLQYLAGGQDLTSDLALALINIIRAELEHPQKQTSSAYRRYSEVTASLHRQMPEVYEQMATAWQQRRRGDASVASPLRSLMPKPVKAASGATYPAESREGEEAAEADEEPAKGGRGATDRAEPGETHEEELEETKEEHEEPEEGEEESEEEEPPEGME